MVREAEAFRDWMKRRFPDRGLHEFGIGVGLHTGEAVIGDIGTPRRGNAHGQGGAPTRCASTS